MSKLKTWSLALGGFVAGALITLQIPAFAQKDATSMNCRNIIMLNLERSINDIIFLVLFVVWLKFSKTAGGYLPVAVVYSSPLRVFRKQKRTRRNLRLLRQRTSLAKRRAARTAQ